MYRTHLCRAERVTVAVGMRLSVFDGAGIAPSAALVPAPPHPWAFAPPAYILQAAPLPLTSPSLPSQAFGRPISEVFSVVSDKPVAAASLGQVYRCTLRPELGGGDVAVKVQRPDVLEQV